MRAIENAWINASYLDLPKTAVGHTQYIDMLPASTMPKLVMKGVDHHERKFVAFRCLATTVDYGNGSEVVPFTMVVFERYSERPGFWVVCGDFCPCGELDEKKMGIIKEMLDGKAVDLSDDFSCSIRLA